MSQGKIYKEEYISTGIIFFKSIRDVDNNIIDLEWVFINSSQEIEGAEEGLLGERLLQVKTGENTKKLFKKYVEVIESGKPLEIEYAFENDSITKWYHIAALKKEDGVIVSCNDITRLKNKEEELRQSEETYRLLTENSTDCISRMNTEGNILYFSPSCKKITGYKSDDLTGKSFYDFMHPDELKSLADLHHTFIQNPAITTHTHKFKKENGDYIWLETAKKPIYDKEGRFLEYQASSRDVSDKKILEEKYLFILENSGDMICNVSREGNYMYVSSSSKKILGYEPEELKDKSFFEFVHSNDREELMNVFNECIQKIHQTTYSARVKNKSREYKWLEYNMVPVKQGIIEGILCTIRDVTERKNTEEALRQLNEELETRVLKRTEELQKEKNLLKTTIDSIPVLIVLIGPDLRVQYLNQTHYEWFGEEARKNLGRRFDELVSEYGIKDSMDMFKKSLSGFQEFYEHEVNDQGEIKYFKSALIHIKDNEGKVAGYISVSIDISKEKIAQIKAQDANEKLQTVLNNAPVIFWSLNKDGYLTTFEGKAVERLALPNEGFIGKSVFSIFEDYPDIIENVNRALRGESFNVTMKVEDVHFQSFYSPIINTEGEITGMAGISTDISDRVKTEEALKASEIKYKSMAEGIPQLVFTALPNGDGDYYNQNWYKYTGQTEEEAMGQGWRMIIHPDDCSKIKEWTYSLKTGEPLDNETRLRRWDGVYRWHLVKSWAVKAEDGKIIKWVGTCTDIHDQKEQREELRSTNKELVKTNNDLDTFVYTASHDLRAPISNMEGLLNFIYKDISPECAEDIQDMIDMTGESLQRLKRTISELTDISRIQRSTNGDKELINIEEEIEEFKKEYKDKIIESEAEIVTSLDINTICFSHKNFKSILYNLLSNAIKFRKPGRPVKINLKTELVNKDCILMSIQDNGLGFDTEQKDKIFSMFKRLHSHVEGTGVGLYIVKRILENVKGKIEVESEPGKGTCFKLYFPMKS